MKHQEEIIRESLDELLAGGTMAAVNHLGAGRSLYFARSPDGELLLGLPAAFLSDEARLAALRYFERAGVAEPGWGQRLSDPSFIFLVDLGADARRAAQMATELLGVVDETGEEAKVRIEVE